VKDHRQLSHQYLNDPGFKAVADCLLHAMEIHVLTPLEVRDAAMFAATRFCMLYGYPRQFELAEDEP
jgi:hypothetical protein